MKLKNSYFFTLREDVKDEESISGNLLVRSGMIRKTSAGIYMFLPLGYKVLTNIENIVREEMNKISSSEVLMPSLVNEEYFEASGRRNNFGKEMFTLKDRFDKNYCLGPTHEELFTIAASYKVRSYKDLPFSLYQIGDKFRDEARPRYGLIRVREFLMKDAYSFDTTEESAEISYNKFKEAYIKIFNRCGIDYKIVESDTGAMGGKLSEEFHALTSIGEDTIVSCECGYATNLEIAKSNIETQESNEIELPKELVHTPNAKSIQEISDFLSQDKSKFVKSLLYKTENGFVLALVSGEDEVNQTKLQKVLNVKSLELATLEEVTKITNSSVGFAGPVEINVKIISDLKIKYKKNFIVGANKTDYHYKNVNLKDFQTEFFDIRIVKEKDKCILCNKELSFSKGIEAGNIFNLGTKYSEAMNLYYSDKSNNLKPVVMGCYGIGIGRIMTSIVEQKNDEEGIVWPTEIAPFKVSIVVVNTNDQKQIEEANKLYQALEEQNISVIMDDRDERVGVKFKDMDLIGIPFRITIGNKINENIVEFKKRTQKEFENINIEDVIKTLKENL